MINTQISSPEQVTAEVKQAEVETSQENTECEKSKVNVVTRSGLNTGQVTDNSGHCRQRSAPAEKVTTSGEDKDVVDADQPSDCDINTTESQSTRKHLREEQLEDVSLHMFWNQSTINGLEAADVTHKYVDDTTLTEFLNHASNSNMQSHVDELIQQATNIGMMINVKKTREMIIGRAVKVSIPLLVLNSEPIQRVDTFKLLGVHISNDLKWGQHVNVILSKAASRLYFLKQLKRAGAGTGDLLCFFNMVVRPVLEYASPVWHSSLTVAQSESLESVQKRAMRIITVHR